MCTLYHFYLPYSQSRQLFPLWYCPSLHFSIGVIKYCQNQKTNYMISIQLGFKILKILTVNGSGNYKRILYQMINVNKVTGTIILFNCYGRCCKFSINTLKQRNKLVYSFARLMVKQSVLPYVHYLDIKLAGTYTSLYSESDGTFTCGERGWACCRKLITTTKSETNSVFVSRNMRFSVVVINRNFYLIQLISQNFKFEFQMFPSKKLDGTYIKCISTFFQQISLANSTHKVFNCSNDF